ncbi:complex I NDUFA9 subunit family protein [Cohaesibacter celericrescens]|uniref:Complex I NDUFA9 subunit family protein n=1 Tax=Cohaesibacter celericrescens TaxID=2067669 RepID=A0A2N5XUG4_9HYPH|nr:complex I NDUFA9 subunit family protein [Cohaesibacter celericrescens]PLW78151.1 complex I NDUFA9 subunit family protein [Cohaesibacter celericrescens]
MTNSTGKIVTVFGGSGFLGRHVVRALAKRGYRVRVAVRRPDLAGFLQPLGNVGQVMPMQANLRNADSVARAVAGCDAVVNLAGILFQTSKQSFDVVHRDGAKSIAEATAKAGISKLVQISAIGANKESASDYARSKAEGEEAVLAAMPDAVIIRPSLLIGVEDEFFNKFAEMGKLSPFLPLVGGGDTLFQPAFVGDVAEVIARGVDGTLAKGTTYELGGPEAKSFRQLLELLLAETHQRRFLLPIPFWIANLLGTVFEKLPKPLLTRDQVKLLKTDNVVSEAAKADGRTFEGLGIEPLAIEAVIPSYLWSYRTTGQYEANRLR